MSLPSFKQEFFDKNRELGALSTNVPLTTTKCSHGHLNASGANSVQCVECKTKWLFEGAIPEVFRERVDSSEAVS